MRERRPRGSVRGALSNGRPYRDHRWVSTWRQVVALNANIRFTFHAMVTKLHSP